MKTSLTLLVPLLPVSRIFLVFLVYTKPRSIHESCRRKIGSDRPSNASYIDQSEDAVEVDERRDLDQQCGMLHARVRLHALVSELRSPCAA